MSDEEKILEPEKTREEYFYVNKKCTYKFLGTVLATFIGALLALYVFAALHKPPVPPAGIQMRPPCPCAMKMFERGQRFDRMYPPKKEFKHRRDFKFHKQFRGHGEFGKKDIQPFVPTGTDKIKLPPQENNAPIKK